ncbi:MAG: ABC transporter permease [Candidatus Pacearchaeota archaeon]
MRVQFLKFAFNNLKARPLRSWLTIIGVIIGVAAVVTFMLIGSGLKSSIKEQFEKIGTDIILVYPGRGMAGAMGAASAERFSEKDLDLIKKVRGVEKVGGMIYKIAKVDFRKETKYTFVIGIPEEIVISDFGIEIEHGRDLRKGDKYNAVIGYEIQNGNFFDKPVKIGNDIIIQGKSFNVVGSASKIGSRQDDTQIYIPIEIAKEILNEKGYSYIMVKSKEGLNTEQVASEVSEALRKDRNLKRGKEDFTVQTYEQLLKAFSDILGIVQMVVVGIAAISLIVGGIGIMNTMYTSVLERTRQIGVMKAIGAKNFDILTIFIFESGIIGLVGGIIGVILGFLAGKAVQFASAIGGYEMLKVSANISIILFGLVFAFLVGVISGLAPARQASKLNPVEALRYE